MRKPSRSIPKFIEDLIFNAENYLVMSSIAPIWLEQLEELKNRFVQYQKKIPNVIDLPKLSKKFQNVLIVGDTHGDVQSTIRITRHFLEGKVDSLVFLGDYTDRGKFSLLNLIILISFTISWPDQVVLLRGNHESRELNHFFGFSDELIKYFPISHDYERVLTIIDEIYEHMSLIAITPQKSICVHAGIPKNHLNLQLINQIPKPHNHMDFVTPDELRAQMEEIFIQIRWNDPIDIPSEDRYKKSYHGYYYYDEYELQEFLTQNNATRIIKSHESLRGGFQKLFKGKLIHIFSTEPYHGKIEQAFIIHENNRSSYARDLDFEIMETL